jgi:KTSC domain
MPFLNVSSSWVDAYYWEGGTLFVRFKDKTGGATVLCQYEDVSLELWLSFLNAPSKGKWVHQHLMGWPYTIVG